MLRLILAMVGTTTAVIFAMVNTHHVTLSFVFGPPVKVRLIFLLLTTFSVGILFASLSYMFRRVRSRRRPRLRPEEQQEVTER